MRAFAVATALLVCGLLLQSLLTVQCDVSSTGDLLIHPALALHEHALVSEVEAKLVESEHETPTETHLISQVEFSSQDASGCAERLLHSSPRELLRTLQRMQV